VRCEQRRETLGIATRYATFGRQAVDRDMAPGGGEARGVAGHVLAVIGIGDTSGEGWGDGHLATGQHP